ncbi:hypothetical protein FJR47_06270 [Sulfurimonas xiamenensis]|uniref:ATP-grasp domain-containing protein n=2 Tax=Sulfurimonas xiamenensis TaxID=2590021 RepID=A0AAJ4A449_9BACT|nr:hypothetical protein FJR47_06270 [Sulfurimonas xiamenensis]
MMKKNILFINGIPDDRKMLIQKINKNGLIKWRGKGGANLSYFLKNDLFDQYDIVFDLKGTQELPRQMIHAVFNQISDADTHKNVLKKADSFYKTVSKHVPFFNPPANVMNTTRDNIYRLLQGVDKLHIPKTVKIQPKSPSDIYNTVEKEHFEFPVIFRQAGDHGGISTVKIDDKTEQFYAFPLDGRDYYLTQFVETAKNKIYAKYRLVVVNGEVFIRHVIYGREWMVHAGSQIEEQEISNYKKSVSKHFLTEIKPLIQPTIDQIYYRIGLDYFGIDCHIDNNMNLLVFEINANMNVFTKSKNSVFTKHIEMARQALINMLIKGKK